MWIAAGCEAANVPFENAAPKTLDAARWWLPVMSWQLARGSILAWGQQQNDSRHVFGGDRRNNAISAASR